MAHQHGAGRIAAAVTGAPGAAVLASLAVPAVLPVPADVRLLIAVLAVLPAAATAVCLALLARSAVRAWGVSAGVAAVATVVLVLS